MKILKCLLAPLLLLMASCTEEPVESEYLNTSTLVVSICQYDSEFFNSPVNPPEYLIINTLRDLAELPEGTIDKTLISQCDRVDYSRNTLIIVTSSIFCEPGMDEDDWNWADVEFNLTKSFDLNIRYRNCSVIPGALYSEKCKIQFCFTVLKIPSDTRLTITESMVSTKKPD